MKHSVEGRGSYWHGYVRTTHGVVGVYSQDGNYDFTRLYCCRDGQEYSRKWDTNYTPSYIVTLAKQFAEDMHHQTLASA